MLGRLITSLTRKPAKKVAHQMPAYVKRAFSSETDLMSFVHEHYGIEDAAEVRLDRPSGVQERQLRYIFRGECEQFEQTVPSERRFMEAHSPSFLAELIERLNMLRNIIADGIEDPKSVLNAQMMALGFPLAGIGGPDELVDVITFSFLQHYGMPSPGIDFTSNPWVALAFASERPEDIRSLQCLTWINTEHWVVMLMTV